MVHRVVRLALHQPLERVRDRLLFLLLLLARKARERNPGGRESARERDSATVRASETELES